MSKGLRFLSWKETRNKRERRRYVCVDTSNIDLGYVSIKINSINGVEQGRYGSSHGFIYGRSESLKWIRVEMPDSVLQCGKLQVEYTLYTRIMNKNFEIEKEAYDNYDWNNFDPDDQYPISPKEFEEGEALVGTFTTTLGIEFINNYRVEEMPTGPTSLPDLD